MLRELEGSGFEFLSQRISYEEIGASTEERVEFGARFFRAATSAATESASAAATAGAVARSAATAGTRAAHVAGSVISVASVAAGYHVTRQIILGAASWIHICCCTRYPADS